MTTQMIIRVDNELKEKLGRLARAEGKTSSDILRELIEGYVSEHDIGSYIDGLWNKIGGELKAKKIKPEDVGKAVKAARKQYA